MDITAIVFAQNVFHRQFGLSAGQGTELVVNFLLHQLDIGVGLLALLAGVAGILGGLRLDLLHGGHLDALGHAVQRNFHIRAAEIVGVLYGLFQILRLDFEPVGILAGGDVKGILEVFPSALDIHGVARVGFVTEGNLVSGHADGNPIRGLIGVAVDGDGLVGQLRPDIVRQIGHRIENLILLEAEAQVLVAVGDAHAAVQGADVRFTGEAEGTRRLGVGEAVVIGVCAQLAAANGVPGGGGQLHYAVNLHRTAGFPGSGDLIRELAVGLRLDCLAEKARGKQVGGGVIGGVLVGQVRHFPDNAAVRILLPTDFGPFLLERGYLRLESRYGVFDHGLGVHAAGQTRDHISGTVNTIAAADAADCHMLFHSFQEF